jgi:ABC-type lipoprotein export system ATPase subunit
VATTLLTRDPLPTASFSSSPADLPLIEIRNLTKLYRMGDTVVRALDGVDLIVRRGDFVAITGASGSGKSTMMHLIGCLDRPTGGTYVLNGQDVSRISESRLSAIRNKEIGFVFQTFNLINRTSALENVSVPLFYARKTNAGAAARRALDHVKMSHRAGHKPNELSGGERQRVAIARAIVNEPLLLLADEPTGNLDTRTGEQIMDLFRELNSQGVTIVIVTHEYDVAIQARRIVHMRDGKILWDRPTSEVVAGDFVLRPKNVGAAAHLSSAAHAPGIESAESGEDEASQNGTFPRAFVQAIAGDGVNTAAPERIRPEEYGPPQRITGALASAVLGILALSLMVSALVVLIIAGLYVRREMGTTTPGQQPPPEVLKKIMPLVIASIGSLIGMATSIVLAIIAIVFGRGALVRLRTALGNFTGRGTAKTGLWTGIATLLIPVAWLAYVLIAWQIKKMQG